MMIDFNDPQFLFDFLINNVEKYGTYDQFVDILYRNIDEIVSELLSNSEDFINAEEDYISNSICRSLVDRRFSAVREVQENGRADIRVKKGSFKWIAEAKRATSMTNVREGFLQLLTRYSKGEGNATSGGLFIYIQGEKNKEADFMHKWVNKELVEQRVVKIMESNPCALKPTCMITTLVHPGSLNVYKLRNMPISFFHNPQDKSGRKAKKYNK